jgi:uncharacterized coiled-coil DUF342 family protein
MDRDEPEDEETKEVKTQIVGAERNFRKMLDKRDELNGQARELRGERDAVNDQKRHLLVEIRRLTAERDAQNAVAREHRDKRNELQRQAKELIEVKKRMRGSGPVGYAGKVRELEGEVKRLEFQQQTTTMSIAKENELLKKVAELRKELEVARVQYADEAKLLAGVKDLDAKIDELFRAADEEHKVVVDAQNAAQAFHNAIEPLVKELRILDQLSDQKHQAFLAAKAQADEIHAKLSEQREKVVALRDQRSAIYRERRQIVEDQNKQARQALFDEEKLDAAADEAIKLLLEKKKLSL